MSSRGGRTRPDSARRRAASPLERDGIASRAAGAVGRATRSTRLHRRILVGVLAAALVAVPVTLQVHLARARHDRDRAQRSAAAAARATRTARARVDHGTAALTGHEARADRAAGIADAARVRLARAGVSEADLRQVVDETRGSVTEVEARSLELSTRLDRQAAERPAAVACVDEVVRALGRAAQSASVGTTSPGPSEGCQVLARDSLDRRPE